MLLVLLSLSSPFAVGADWQRYHADPEQGRELFIDLDSLGQTPESFAADIRLSMWHGDQVFQGRQAVDCAAGTFTLSNLHELGVDQKSGENSFDDAGPIEAGTALSGLQELYCARWQEPPGVRWKILSASTQTVYFYDERIEQQRGNAGFNDAFNLYLKTQGADQSLLADIRISCRENTFTGLSGTKRDEARGWLANLPAGSTRTPDPDSPIAGLMSLLCQPTDGPGHPPVPSPQGALP